MKLHTPLTEETVRRLRVGDRVQLSGEIVTARDMAHRYLTESKKAPCRMNVIYHCGPIVKDGKAVSAGPTTSIREEPYEAEVIRRFGVKAVIGKGGMGENTRKALARHGCVYLSAVGGAGALIADRITRVEGVYKLDEFGMPEAIWVFEVSDMPLIVTMDTKGRSLYKKVEEDSLKRLNSLIR